MMATATMAQAVLRDRRILVVEDEYVIATGPGGRRGGRARSRPARQRRHATGRGRRPDRLRAPGRNLSNEAIWLVAGALLARGVPFVLTTGYDATAIPPAYAPQPRGVQPVDAGNGEALPMPSNVSGRHGLIACQANIEQARVDVLSLERRALGAGHQDTSMQAPRPAPPVNSQSGNTFS